MKFLDHSGKLVAIIVFIIIILYLFGVFEKFQNVFEKFTKFEKFQNKIEDHYRDEELDRLRMAFPNQIDI
tara:strand:- start:554 stop:763 length:210 start_codon:yes stop_codon:yes gene_type:complete